MTLVVFYFFFIFLYSFITFIRFYFLIVFAVVCLCVCLSAVVAALVANKDIYINLGSPCIRPRSILSVIFNGLLFAFGLRRAKVLG